MRLLDVRLRKPGLFVTGTDTGVGKTLVSCGIAHHLRLASLRVGVCKPLATGCRREPGGGLVSDDAIALARFSGCTQPLEVINPLRYEPPMSPAAAARQEGRPVDLSAVARSLHVLDATHDVLVVEGVGGLLAPILDSDPKVTVLDLAGWIGYPVVVVTRARLGTLNHTAMTVRLLRQAGCRLAGLVVNGYAASKTSEGASGGGADLSMSSNREWLESMNDTSILATVPACPAGSVSPERGIIAEEALAAIGSAHWPDWADCSAPAKGG